MTRLWLPSYWPPSFGAFTGFGLLPHPLAAGAPMGTSTRAAAASQAAIRGDTPSPYKRVRRIASHGRLAHPEFLTYAGMTRVPRRHSDDSLLPRGLRALPRRTRGDGPHALLHDEAVCLPKARDLRRCLPGLRDLEHDVSRHAPEPGRRP